MNIWITEEYEPGGPVVILHKGMVKAVDFIAILEDCIEERAENK